MSEQQPQPPPPEAQPASPQNPPPPLTRNGKVARLPKATRDKINVMLQDGVPYLQIISRLAPETDAITESNLSNWKAGGYLEWLRTIQLAEAIRAKHELAEDIVQTSPDANAAGQAILKVIATNLCAFLADTDPDIIRDSLLSDADKFTRFVNSMVRLAEGGIKCELHKFRFDDRIAAAEKDNTPAQKPGITDESLHLAEEKLKLF